jgi:hypothetical protein
MQFLTGVLNINDWFNKIKENIRPYMEDKKLIKEHDMTLIEEINEAHDEWIEAQRYFECVSEPELVDHAIYTMQAAKIKYMYLLNKVKRF